VTRIEIGDKVAAELVEHLKQGQSVLIVPHDRPRDILDELVRILDVPVITVQIDHKHGAPIAAMGRVRAPGTTGNPN
jgi:hypothetical protein